MCRTAYHCEASKPGCETWASPPATFWAEAMCQPVASSVTSEDCAANAVKANKPSRRTKAKFRFISFDRQNELFETERNYCRLAGPQAQVCCCSCTKNAKGGVGMFPQRTKKKAAPWARPASRRNNRRLSLRLRGGFYAGWTRGGRQSTRGWRCRRSSYARDGVVLLHDGLGQVSGSTRPQHGAVLVGNVEHQRVTVALGVFVQHLHHLLANALQNIVLLALEIGLGILQIALQLFLFGFNAADQVGAGHVVELVALGVELLFEVIHLVVHALKLGLLGLELFGERLEIALTLIAGQDGLLHIDDADLPDRRC